MIIKVCGMRDADNIREVESLGIDMMGFIFWPKSSRYVAERPAYLPTKCKRVGVFVDATAEDIMRHVGAYGLDIIQLHGKESPEFISQLINDLSPETKIIKALNIATEKDLDSAKRYEGTADYLLFDTKGKSVGGNGEKFDWSVLKHYHGTTPYLLSGGISPEDVTLVRTVNSIGIDLNSKFELSPALKDIDKLNKFIKQIRS
ncbi:MAG: phosphoribosylanthranilate isomerase [Prevotella sp.]|nr:phosphoribosylanthranilate isomerase [Prevotella sp.]